MHRRAKLLNSISNRIYPTAQQAHFQDLNRQINYVPTFATKSLEFAESGSGLHLVA